MYGSGIAGRCHVTTVQTQWSKCWGSNVIGEGLATGEFHGCMTYTHTTGQRNRFVEFSDGILQMNKPAGILTRLNNGVPVVSPTTVDFTGIKLGDVTGWAPTPDTFVFNKNYCVDL